MPAPIPNDMIEVIPVNKGGKLYARNTDCSIRYSNAAHTAEDMCLMGEDEIIALAKLATDKIVVEIGSFRGGSAHVMLPVCVHLTCIDPHDDMWWTGVKGKTPADQKGKEVQADFLKVIAPFKEKCVYIQKYSYDVIEIPECDVLFIDGDHSFMGCQGDLLRFVEASHCKYVACHDYCLAFCGVIAACQLFFKRNPDYLINTLAVYKL